MKVDDPLTLELPRERHSDRARRVGAAVAAFRQVRVPYPPQTELIYEFDELRQVGLASVGEPQDVLVVLQETFAGKTTAAKRFRSHVLQTGDYRPGEVPVAIATCNAGTSSKALVTALLRSLDVRLSAGMSEDALWQIWPDACRRKRVEIAVIDEVQHCHDGKFGQGVTNTLKNKLAAGVPIIALGTRKATELFTTNDEFNSRVYSTLALRTMIWEDDRDDWTTLCRHLDQAMHEAGITSGLAGLDQPEAARPLCEASLGRIGLLKKILQTALRLALRDGRDVIATADLGRAVDVWAVKQRFVATNPFAA